MSKEVYNSYYVYAYIRDKDSPTAKAGMPYYIGKGYGERAWANHKNIPVPKNSEFIVIMENNLTEIGAFPWKEDILDGMEEKIIILEF
jgi:hypothetical protein